MTYQFLLNAAELVFQMGARKRVRHHIQNNGPAPIYVLDPPAATVATTTSGATAAADTYLTLTSVAGIKQGMKITSAAVAANAAATTYGVVLSVDPSTNRVYLFNCQGAVAAGGTAATFSMPVAAGMGTAPPGIKLNVGEILTVTGVPGALSGKSGALIYMESGAGTASVSVMDEEN